MSTSTIRSSEDVSAIDSNELPGLFAGLASFDTVFLAVSGGVDSIALMHLAADWFQDEATVGERLGALHVLTVNHGLRPEAAHEVEAVAAAAAERGLPAEVLNWRGEIPRTGIQEAAREIRYGLLIDRLRTERANGRTVALVTAHHRDDLAETMLMRLARGAGVDGLAAMQPTAARDGIDILRPLLGLPKARLRATLLARGITWQDDPSNNNPAFERVQLRGAADLRNALGLSDAALARTAGRIARARCALEKMVDQLMLARLADPLLVRCGVFAWPWRAGQIADELAIRILMRVLPAIGGRDGAIRLMRVERLYEDMQRGGFAGATLANCVVTAVKSKMSAGEFHIFREPNRAQLPVVSSNLEAPLVWDNRFKIICPPADKTIFKLRALTPEDLKLFDFEALTEKPACPIEALMATPVLEGRNGQLAIPALDVHLKPPEASANAAIDCRFMVERMASR